MHYEYSSVNLKAQCDRSETSNSGLKFSVHIQYTYVGIVYTSHINAEGAMLGMIMIVMHTYLKYIYLKIQVLNMTTMVYGFFLT